MNAECQVQMHVFHACQLSCMHAHMMNAAKYSQHCVQRHPLVLSVFDVATNQPAKGSDPITQFACTLLEAWGSSMGSHALQMQMHNLCMPLRIHANAQPVIALAHSCKCRWPGLLVVLPGPPLRGSETSRRDDSAHHSLGRTQLGAAGGTVSV